eukprot:7295708-Alexandrium_andersonii.AAC.1
MGEAPSVGGGVGGWQHARSQGGRGRVSQHGEPPRRPPELGATLALLGWLRGCKAIFLASPPPASRARACPLAG